MTVAEMRVNVNNEWAPLRVALYHDADNMIDRVPVDALGAKHPEQGYVRREIFKRQHYRFRQLLENAGVKLIAPQSQPDAFCQVFIRDPCFVIGNTFFVSRMRENYRQLETAGLTEVHSRVTRDVVLKYGVLEGGDVMVLRDDIVLVGSGEITDAEGIATLRSHLDDLGIEVVCVPHSALHLDCCLAPLPNNKCLFSLARLPEPSRVLLRPYFSELVPLNPHEDLTFLAANLIWLNAEEVVSTTHVLETNRFLREMCYKVHEVEYSEVIHLWGSVRCTVGPLVRES